MNEHLASCYSRGTTSRNISNSPLRQGVRHFDDTFEVEELVFPPTSMYH